MPFIPLSIVLISVIVENLTSTVLFIVNEVTFIVMPFADPLYSRTILLNFSLLVDADVAKI